jgi:hypothetical protein
MTSFVAVQEGFGGTAASPPVSSVSVGVNTMRERRAPRRDASTAMPDDSGTPESGRRALLNGNKEDATVGVVKGNQLASEAVLPRAFSLVEPIVSAEKAVDRLKKPVPAIAVSEAMRSAHTDAGDGGIDSDEADTVRFADGAPGGSTEDGVDIIDGDDEPERRSILDDYFIGSSRRRRDSEGSSDGEPAAGGGLALRAAFDWDTRASGAAHRYSASAADDQSTDGAAAPKQSGRLKSARDDGDEDDGAGGEEHREEEEDTASSEEGSGEYSEEEDEDEDAETASTASDGIGEEDDYYDYEGSLRGGLYLRADRGPVDPLSSTGSEFIWKNPAWAAAAEADEVSPDDSFSIIQQYYGKK